MGSLKRNCSSMRVTSEKEGSTIHSQMASQYGICIPVYGSTVESLEAMAESARLSHPDLIELRLDYIRNLDCTKLLKVKSILQGNEILTVRSRKEGGHLQVSESRRIEIIRSIILHLKPLLVDVEISTLQENRKLLREIVKSGSKLIASFHDLHGNKTLRCLREIIFRAPLKSKSLFAVKIVSEARTIQDNLKVLSLYPILKQNASALSASELIAFCTGQLGIPSRILCVFLGSPLSYASLAQQRVASGQLDFGMMKRTLSYW